jgi:hypothetical protein
MAKIAGCPSCGNPWNPVNSGAEYCRCYWWTPSHCLFTRKQMMFLVFWYELKSLWPLKPIAGADNNVNKGLAVKACGDFELGGSFNAELEKRLETTGEAGEALAGELTRVVLFQDLFAGQAGHVYPEEEYYLTLSAPARRALNYITGWNRRKMGYRKWCRQQVMRQKKTPGV